MLQQRVSGQVTDNAGEPLPGVSVLLKGSLNGTSTDPEGRYTLENIPEGGVLVFSFIGYKTREEATGGRELVNVSLEPDVASLEEVVVVGYGTQKKVNLTGAVDQVTSEVLENRPMPNVSQGLVGVIPNLNIDMQDGKPIQSPTFNIRGNTSIGQGGSALVLIDGVEGDPRTLNPSDIASVTVLKDASSAAIYGARGAFGVVLITTKAPAEGKTSVSYSINQSFKQPTTVPDLVTDGYLWAKMFNEAWTAWNDYSQTPQNVNKTLKFSQEYLAELERRSNDPSLPDVEVNENGEYVYYGSTDWYDLLYKDDFSSTEHNLSVSGSSGKASYYVTGRLFGQDGLFRYNSDDYKMYNLRAKGAVQLFPWLNVENNASYSSMQYHNPLNVGEGGSIWRNIADEGHPMSPLLNPDGTLTYSAAYTVGDFYYGKNGIDMNRKVLRNTTSFNTNFYDNKFRLKGDFTFQNTDYDEQRLRVKVPYSRKPGVIEYVGTNYNDIQNVLDRTQYLATNFYGEYENTFAGKHYFKGMAGYNYEQSTFKGISNLRNGLIFEDAKDINLALGQSIVTGGGYERWNIMGGFFRLNYAYDSRYLLEVNGRYDGSSKFPESQRYAFFPSVSVGWRVSEEPFWKVSENMISNLKIRASYGSLGNGSIESYSFQEKFTIEQSGRVLGGVRPQKTGQPSVIPDGLTWETSTTRNIGIDLAMLRDRLNIVADAYVRETTDMFTVGPELPAVFGTDVPRGNYADLRTKGWELTVAWRDAFELGSKPFNYDIRATLADYQAEITKFNNENNDLDNYYVGQKLGEIWGYETQGFFRSEEEIENAADQTDIRASTSGQLLPGDIRFRDLNNDGVIDNGLNRADSAGDMRVIGNSTPRYSYGINLGASWNNFFFSAFFQGVAKQDWFPDREASIFWGQYNRPYNDMPKWQIGNIWSEDNPDAFLPRYRGYIAQGADRELSTPQTKYILNIAYIRLKNLQVGYNLPAQLISRVGLSQARIYLTGENLWSWSPLYRITRDLDVESTSGSDRVLTSRNVDERGAGNGYNYPMIKSFTLGLSLTF
ncbi:TonB-dependent receptor [Anseongella ginsenosidimutans]|nr:TonB-dependent receptor [Anseongella ginsenosidimutans]